jgi:adenine specific DNA methylase Mod
MRNKAYDDAVKKQTKKLKKNPPKNKQKQNKTKSKQTTNFSSFGLNNVPSQKIKQMADLQPSSVRYLQMCLL